MQKIRVFFILLLFPFCLQAQQKTKIILQSFDAIRVEAKTNTSYLRNPVFRQDNATLACDSAVFFEARNVFDAFDHVHINQADTINIFSDRLTYDGNTKIAHLTSNVKMIDKESVLTTNTLDYKMTSKVGNYIDGGKIVNKDVTLTSRVGYYFSGTRDAFFSYNVVVVTPQTTITSDTLRYNTLTNWAYFYGPTNIKGKDDNLYTENGAYNTRTEYAYFGKANLYTQGAKSLRGDSLYYDGIAGYGKAVRNIVFKDTTDKTVMYGQLGFYYKIDQRALVTKNAYVGLGTSDSVMINKKLRPDSLWMGADTLETQMVLRKSLKLITAPVLKKDNELGEEEGPKEAKIGEAKAGAKTGTTAKDSKKLPAVPGTEVKPTKKLSKKEKKALEKRIKNGEIPPPDSIKTILPGVKDSLLKAITLKDSMPKDSLKLKKDTISILKDSISKGIIKKASVKDVKTKAGTDKNAKVTATKPTDSKAVALGNKAVTDPKQAKTTLVKDSLPFNPADTIKTRAIKAYHNVRVYKSNMQARADSLFYTSADSTLRWYGSPVLWAEGSQQTGDTIYLRLKNKTLSSSQVIEKGFLVNVYADSVKYNQIKGKIITGFFNDGKLERMFVDGNAESVYYNRTDSAKYTEMNQTVSSRIKMLFKDKEITQIITIKDPEGVRTPIAELKQDVFLTGFTWKPELRPLSKKEVINGKPKAKAAAKGTATKGKGTPLKDTPKGKEQLKKEGLKKAKAVLEKVLPVKEIMRDLIKSDSTTILKPILKQDTVKPLKLDTLKVAKPAPSKKQ